MSDMETTWFKAIETEMQRHGESWSDVIHSTLTTDELHSEFDDTYGYPEGRPFTVWTRNRVYFPATYDGKEWAASVPRNPSDEKTGHVGGY